MELFKTMPVTVGPHLSLTLRPSEAPTALRLFDFMYRILQEGVLVPGAKKHTVNLSGEVQLTGPVDPSTRSEIEQLSDGLIFSGFQFDLRAHENRPRLIVKYQHIHNTLTLSYQNVPSDALREKAKIEFLSLVGEQRNRSKRGLGNIGLRRDSIIDCYALESRLGRGYSAEVWKAEVVGVPHGVSLAIGDKIALKLYTRINATDTLRVQREFQVAADVRHPHLVRVYDLLLSPSRPNHNFLVMELIDGRDLKSLIPHRGMSAKRIVKLTIQIAGALRELHAAGAFHRDIKSANIMVRRSDSAGDDAVLCDLGIVSVEGDPSLTGTRFMGSKHYAPLEQLAGDDLDARSDIYALGAVMAHCYKGRPLYHKAGPEVAIARRMWEGNSERLTAKQIEDAPLVELINTTTAVDPADRPADASDLLRRLETLS